MGIIIWEIAYRCLNGEHAEPYENVKASGLQLLYKVAADGIRPQPLRHCPKEIQNIIDSCLGNEVMMRPDFSVLVERLRGIEKVYNANKEAWEELRQSAPPYLPATASPISSNSPSTMSSMNSTDYNNDNYDNYNLNSVNNNVLASILQTNDEEDFTGNDDTTTENITEIDNGSFIHEL